MLTTPAYDVSVDERRQTLYLDLMGPLARAEIDEAARTLIVTASGVDKEYTVVVDLRAFRPPSSAAADAIETALEDLTDVGLDRVIRVVDDGTGETVTAAFERRLPSVGHDVDSVVAAERIITEPLAQT